MIDYDADLLKHHVRTEGWLPRCKRRHKSVSESGTPRRLRYFTFCASGAIDVLMLDVANLLGSVSGSDRKFDNVSFFDKDPDSVRTTQVNIPFAVGFSGDFVDTVLIEDSESDDEDSALLEQISSGDPLQPVAESEDKISTRRLQRRLGNHLEFKKRFPFDIVNLDLEEYLFKPTEELPGRVINAMRKVFAWQRNSFTIPSHRGEKTLDGFTLMFTTQVGPPNLTENYLLMLQDYIEKNLQSDTSLFDVFRSRTGFTTVTELRANSFRDFFMLAIPKTIASTLMEEDWYIDPEAGLCIYEYERQQTNGDPYKIIHLVMDVKRQTPPKKRRAPGIVQTVEAQNAYKRFAAQIFQQPPITLKEENLDSDELKSSLSKIILRRKKYSKAD